MQHIFVDTNVIVDFLTDRDPFAEDAAKIFSSAESKKLIVNICALSYSNIYYVLRKYAPHKKVIEKLEQMSSICNTLQVDFNTIQQALKSDFSDFEDAIQYYCALQNKQCKIIITRNQKDFKKSNLATMTPEIFLKSFPLLFR